MQFSDESHNHTHSLINHQSDESLIRVQEPTTTTATAAKELLLPTLVKKQLLPLPSPNLRRSLEERVQKLGNMSETAREEISEALNLDLWKKEVNGRIIGIAIDGSDDGDKAFYWVLHNLIKTSVNMNNKIILLTCRSTSSTETNRLESETLLRSYMNLIKTAGLDKVPVRSFILKGDVRHEICDAVEKLGVDVLCIGTRGLGVLKRAVLGSVSDYLSKNSVCTCIIAK